MMGSLAVPVMVTPPVPAATLLTIPETGPTSVVVPVALPMVVLPVPVLFKPRAALLIGFGTLPAGTLMMGSLAVPVIVTPPVPAATLLTIPETGPTSVVVPVVLPIVVLPVPVLLTLMVGETSATAPLDVEPMFVVPEPSVLILKSPL
jgi:hypothetical protein